VLNVQEERTDVLQSGFIAVHSDGSGGHGRQPRPAVRHQPGNALAVDHGPGLALRRTRLQRRPLCPATHRHRPYQPRKAIEHGAEGLQPRPELLIGSGQPRGHSSLRRGQRSRRMRHPALPSPAQAAPTAQTQAAAASPQAATAATAATMMISN